MNRRPTILGIRCFLAVALLLIAGCGDSATKEEKVYELKGDVTKLGPEPKKLTIAHEEIPGYMKAMEMEFEVEDAKDLEGIAVGDDVHGKLRVLPDGKLIVRGLHKH